MDKKEKYIAKTKGGTDTMSTKDSKLLKLMKGLVGEGVGRILSDSDKLKQYKKISDVLTKKDGGMVKKYKKGGSVKKNKMLTTKGWGASRKT